MKLVIYNTANSRTAEDRIGRRSIRFNSVNGNMYLSLHLTKDLNVKPGDRLEFARDEDDPKAWFLRKTTDKPGFPLPSNGGGIRLHNTVVCQTVLDTVKSRGARFFLCRKTPYRRNRAFFIRYSFPVPFTRTAPRSVNPPPKRRRTAPRLRPFVRKVPSDRTDGGPTLYRVPVARTFPVALNVCLFYRFPCRL